MDAFMDKLAQKLTASEIIKANSAAEAQELNHMKEQVKQYEECINEMLRINESTLSNTEKMETMIDAVAKATGRIGVAIETVTDTATRKMESSAETVTDTATKKMESSAIIVTNRATEKIEEVVCSVTEKINNTNLQIENLNLDALKENINDFVHKENVKVYRNVQAVVVEEMGKQKESINSSVEEIKKKIIAVLSVSILALLMSMGTLAFVVLSYFGVI